MKPTVRKISNSSKQRALRIPLNFVKSWDRVQIFKWGLTAAACVLSTFYVAYVTLWPNQPYSAFSPGELAAAHTTWEHNCSACHADFVPVRDDSYPLLSEIGLSGREFSTSAGKSTKSGHVEVKCQRCHASHVHHANEKVGDSGSCASCHRDHQGRNATIARPSDEYCVRCHGDVSHHIEGGKSAFDPAIKNVNSFFANHEGVPSGHPEFRSLMKDPGNIKFNHQLHMTRGLPHADPDKGLQYWKFANMDPTAATKYWQELHGAEVPFNGDETVSLQCSSCHRSSQEGTQAKIETASMSQTITSAYAAPLRFERDCKGCHALYFDGAHESQLPHGLSPAKIHEFLLAHYTEKQLAHAAGDPPATPRLVIPGRATPRYR